MLHYQDALAAVHEWAVSEPSTLCKGAAQAYVEALPEAEAEGLHFYNSASKGRAIQLLYVLSNLQGWRGETAREAKKILKKQYDKDK